MEVQYPATDTAAAFGGLSHLADAIGATRQQVFAWKHNASGLIPRWWSAKIKAAAKETGVTLPTPYGFGVQHLPKPKRRAAK